MNSRELPGRTSLYDAPPSAALHLIGARIVVPEDGIVARITEVEAYGGPAESPWPDPAAHCWPGPRPRNRAMFGDAGHLYVYRSYGIHLCANVTCCAEGIGGGILIRSIAIESGEQQVRNRRGDTVIFDNLGRGPGNVGSALGITLADYAIDLFDSESRVHVEIGAGDVEKQKLHVRSGPRIGVRAASERPWRLWLEHPSVSAFRRHKHATGDF